MRFLWSFSLVVDLVCAYSLKAQYIPVPAPPSTAITNEKVEMTLTFLRCNASSAVWFGFWVDIRWCKCIN